LAVAAPRSKRSRDRQLTEPTAAQSRVIDAALELFARHGVGGTSLQMIADELGVTKAAVYHQYHSKDDIILAAAMAELAGLRGVIERAEELQPSRRARDAMVSGMVDLAIENRRTVGTILSDPAVVSFFGDEPEFRDAMQRLRRLLMGDDATAHARVRTAMLVAAISGAVMHPFVVEMDDDVLRDELLQLARRFLGSAR
jgi:AcrR family transcriptional regulator